MKLLDTPPSSALGPKTAWPIPLSAPLPAEDSGYWVCLDVKYSFGIERSKYGNPDEMETVDVIRFLFVSKKGEYVFTKEMKISAYHKSGLMQFLTSWLGKAPPVDGSLEMDDMIGVGAQISIEHSTSQRGKTYANISSIAPVMKDSEDKVPNVADFEVPGKDEDPVDAEPAAEKAPKADDAEEEEMY